jgi:hypothetical protein
LSAAAESLRACGDAVRVGDGRFFSFNVVGRSAASTASTDPFSTDSAAGLPTRLPAADGAASSLAPESPAQPAAAADPAPGVEGLEVSFDFAGDLALAAAQRRDPRSHFSVAAWATCLDLDLRGVGQCRAFTEAWCRHLDLPPGSERPVTDQGQRGLLE